jgi:predicted RNA-binding protein YlxR (DUF448 family)
MASAPERSCSVCRTRLPREQLQRWTVVDGEAVQSEQDGRGYYSCLDCADKAKLVIEGRSQAKNNKRRA